MIAFALPPAAEADRPPEERGLSRDGVRLLVATPDGIGSHRFADLPDLLAPGDLVVVNSSATLPAALDATGPDGRELPVHVSTVLDDGTWVVEPRRSDGRGPDRTLARGDVLSVPGDLRLRLVAPHDAHRLWRAAPSRPVDPVRHLSDHGRPVRYGHHAGSWPLPAFQTVFATEPGSAEMASAGRPFTAELVVRLVVRGVLVAPVVLHAGVSSAEAGEPPQAERFRVPATTARLVRETQQAGGRVVAVGTTVTRALESAADADGVVQPAEGWTDLVLGPQRPARVVDGLVTGWHAPGASHLALLEAVAGEPLVAAAYAAAVDEGLLWHEFGDSCLLLPRRPRA